MCFKPRLGLKRLTKQVHKWIGRREYGSISKASGMVKYHEQPDKSEGDPKLYRTLSLSNGLRAMLISDPYIDNQVSSESLGSSAESFHGKLAACAVLVDVGSFSEPREYQGLAHFVEHMMFMGSEKFPVENEFDSFVTKSGGFSNAHTENEETCFYFEVDESHLDKSMDIFMNLIKAPLMLSDSMNRERSAVQSEFEQTFMSDDVRRDQILASLASDDYPHGTFSWGNLKSLQEGVDDTQLHQALHLFRRNHYGANRMIVAIQAQLSLDELEELLVRHCADIPKSQENARDLSKFNYQTAFREEFFRDLFLVQPVEDVCKVEFTWVLPPMKKFYRCKPDSFLAQLMGYEGVGSLCSYLRRRLWCISVMAGVSGSSFDSNSIYSLFTICIYLTDDGFDHLDNVMEATFAWIRLLINSDRLPTSYREFQQIANNNFRFQIEIPSIDNVQSIVENLNYLPFKDALTGPQIYFQYVESDIQLLREQLSKFNFNIMISSYIPYEQNEYDQKEPWFGAQYKTIAMPPKWIKLWQEPTTFKELHFPDPNPFVTTDFTLHWIEAGKPHISRSPKVLLRNDLCELWFRQDNVFQLPNGYINLYFITPLVRESVKHYMLGVLYTYLVEFAMAEELYPALEAGLTYGLYIGDKGLVMRVSGYNEKLPLLVEIILNVMQAVDLDVNQVASFKDLKKRQIYNGLINGRTLNLDLRLSVLENQRFTMISKYEAIDAITVEDIKSFKDNFHKKMYVKCLIQGNFTEEQATELMQKVLDTYNSEKIENLSALDNNIVQLPLGSYYLRAMTLNEDDSNTIITNYYQIGPNDLKVECLMDLVELIVEEPLFNQLRTQEQLGYSLGISQRIGYGVIAFLIFIVTQETKHKADFVEQRIEAFRSRMSELVSQMSEEDFNDIREILISSKKLGDTSLDEEVMRNWSEIVTMEYFFNRMEMQIQTLNRLTKDDVLNFLKDYDKNNLRKLSVQVVGNQLLPSDSKSTDNLEYESRPGSLSDLLDDEQNISNHQISNKPIAEKIKIEFLGKSDDPSNIRDISAFKKSLYVYPLFNTNPNLANKS
ncbi:nardilysin [Drosophila ficusphila]|uniref:nardilysin n=1 Tax=Drosophila ficusphila TaxID=30025 RepID=UPI0007E7D701|nr:nardilysin [Drosophila ficusphila]